MFFPSPDRWQQIVPAKDFLVRPRRLGGGFFSVQNFMVMTWGGKIVFAVWKGILKAQICRYRNMPFFFKNVSEGVSIGNCNWNLLIDIAREAFEICNVAPRHTATMKNGVKLLAKRADEKNKPGCLDGAYIYVPNLHIWLLICFAPLLYTYPQLLTSYWLVTVPQLPAEDGCLKPSGPFCYTFVSSWNHRASPRPWWWSWSRNVAKHWEGSRDKRISFRISHDTRPIGKFFADTTVLETCTPLCCGTGHFRRRKAHSTAVESS